jgi:hypothetical protein
MEASNLFSDLIDAKQEQYGLDFSMHKDAFFAIGIIDYEPENEEGDMRNLLSLHGSEKGIIDSIIKCMRGNKDMREIILKSCKLFIENFGSLN